MTSATLGIGAGASAKGNVMKVRPSDLTIEAEVVRSAAHFARDVRARRQALLRIPKGRHLTSFETVQLELASVEVEKAMENFRSASIAYCEDKLQRVRDYRMELRREVNIQLERLCALLLELNVELDPTSPETFAASIGAEITCGHHSSVFFNTLQQNFAGRLRRPMATANELIETEAHYSGEVARFAGLTDLELVAELERCEIRREERHG